MLACSGTVDFAPQQVEHRYLDCNTRGMRCEGTKKIVSRANSGGHKTIPTTLHFEFPVAHRMMKDSKDSSSTSASASYLAGPEAAAGDRMHVIEDKLKKVTQSQPLSLTMWNKGRVSNQTMDRTYLEHKAVVFVIFMELVDSLTITF